MTPQSNPLAAPPETAVSSRPEKRLARIAGSLPWGTGGLLSLAAVALAVRVFRLGEVPGNVTADETDFLRNAYHIMAGTGPGFFGFDWTPSPAFSVYLITGSMKVFGVGIVGARMCPALVGTATVVAFFFLAREWLSYPASLLAGLLLATNVWFLHFSRTAWTNINADLFAVAGVLMLTLAIRKQRWYFYAGAGVFAALGLYGYSTGNIIVVLFLAYLPIALLMNRNQSRQILRGYAVLLAVCGVVFLPQAREIFHNWDIFTARVRFTSIFNAEIPYGGESNMARVLARQALWAAKAFIFIDGSPGVMGHGLWSRYIPPESGLLGPYVRLLFFVGLAGAASKWRQTALWWIMFLVPVFVVQVLSRGTPDASRGLIVAPFMFLFVGEGIERLLAAGRWLGQRRWFATRFPALSTGTALALSVVVAVVAAGNVGDYFDWMSTPEALGARGPGVSREAFSLWQRMEQESAARGPERFGWPRWCALQTANGGIDDAQTALVCRDMVPKLWAVCSKGQLAGPVDRDQSRQADLARLGVAAAEYRQRYGKYPSTNGEVLPLCAYPNPDSGCKLEEFMTLLPDETLADTSCFPYLYASDGKSFTLYTMLETEPAEAPACVRPEELAGVSHFYCVAGP
jgi:4-amino-4-deoxy-L-arabinose transferase-like glycosyltransferase